MQIEVVVELALQCAQISVNHAVVGNREHVALLHFVDVCDTRIYVARLNLVCHEMQPGANVIARLAAGYELLKRQDVRWPIRLRERIKIITKSIYAIRMRVGCHQVEEFALSRHEKGVLQCTEGFALFGGHGHLNSFRNGRAPAPRARGPSGLKMSVAVTTLGVSQQAARPAELFQKELEHDCDIQRNQSAKHPLHQVDFSDEGVETAFDFHLS